MDESAGTLGYSPRIQRSGPESVFITNPISLHARIPSTDRSLIQFPGGFLLHTGLPNAGWKSIRRAYAAHWAQSPIPVWIHLICQDLSELEGIIRDCEEMEGIAAIELGLPPACPRDWMLQLIQSARGEIPLVIHLSAGEDSYLLKSLPDGISAVTLGTPRGALMSTQGKLVHGRLHGPGLFPLMFNRLLDLISLNIPIILGGICNKHDGEIALQHGALAVQVDTFCWQDELSV